MLAVIPPARAQTQSGYPAQSGYPVASDARLAGDAKLTRFVLDLDRPVQFRAFALSDPYRVVVDMPQVNFRLPAGTGGTGRGLVKTFRYGLVMPGGSRIVIDLAGPAKVANSYVLDSANGQPPRLVLELEEVDRAGFAQAQAQTQAQNQNQAATLPPPAENRSETKPATPEIKGRGFHVWNSTGSAPAAGRSARSAASGRDRSRAWRGR